MDVRFQSQLEMETLEEVKLPDGVSRRTSNSFSSIWPHIGRFALVKHRL